MPNIFDYATKELSQDAFFCWLLAWLSPEFDNEPLQKQAMYFLDAVTPSEYKNKIQKITKVVIFKQYKKIDFIVCINKELVYLFEDKIKSKEHGDQLNVYKKIISNDFKNHKPILIYIKTDIVWPAEIQNVTEKGFSVFDIYKIKDMLSININNDIYNDYIESITKRIHNYESFATQEVSNWSHDNWLGFLYKISNEINYSFFDSHYVGDNFWFVLSWVDNYKGYSKTHLSLEINTNRLVVKMHNYDNRINKKERRNLLINDIIKPFNNYNPIVSNRSGTSVVLFELPNFLFLSKGILDIKQTLNFIHEVKEVFDITTAST